MLSFFLTLALLMLWLRLLPQRNPKIFFNPYIAAVMAWIGRGIDFLRQAFPFLSPYAAATVAFAFLLAFRGIVAAGLKLNLSEFVGVWTFKTQQGSPPLAIAFSLVSFGLLLHRLWTMDWLLSLLSARRRRNRAGQAFSALCSPMYLVPLIPRGLFLLLFGGVLMTLLFTVGIPESALTAQMFPAMSGNDAFQNVANSLQAASTHVAKAQRISFGLFWVLGAMAMTDVLTFAINVLILCLLTSIAGTLFKWPLLSSLGTEGVQQMIETVFRKPVRWGSFNFAPILFLLVLSLARGVLMAGLVYGLQYARSAM